MAANVGFSERQIVRMSAVVMALLCPRFDEVEIGFKHENRVRPFSVLSSDLRGDVVIP